MEILREARLQANQVLIISSVLQQTNEHQNELFTNSSSSSSSFPLDKMILEMVMLPGDPGCTSGQCIPGDRDDDTVARPGSFSTQSVPSSASFARSRSSCCHHYYYLSTASSSCDVENWEEEEDNNDEYGDQHNNVSSSNNNRLIPNNRRRSEMPTIINLLTNRPKGQMSF